MNDTTENRSSAISKPPNILDEWNGYPEFFSFSQALEISRKYLLLQTLIIILQKKVAGWPLKTPDLRCQSPGFWELLFKHSRFSRFAWLRVGRSDT